MQYRRVVCSIVIAVLVLAVGVPALAQETSRLSPEEIALIDRVVMVNEQIESYDSYVFEEDAREVETLVFSFNSESVTAARAIESQRTGTMVKVNGAETIRAEYHLSVERTVSNDPNLLTYTASAEARLVEDTLYVNAVYDQLPAQEGVELPELPEGWAIIEDPESHPIFDWMDIEKLLDPPALIDDPALIKAAASEVTLEEVTLEAGTSAEVITILFDQEGVAQVLRAFVDSDVDPAAFEAQVAGLTGESNIAMILTLGADNTVLAYESTGLVQMVGLDANLLNPGRFREGTVIDTTSETVLRQTVAQVNDPALQPATVPEGLESK